MIGQSARLSKGTIKTHYHTKTVITKDRIICNIKVQNMHANMQISGKKSVILFLNVFYSKILCTAINNNN